MKRLIICLSIFSLNFICFANTENQETVIIRPQKNSVNISETDNTDKNIQKSTPEKVTLKEITDLELNTESFDKLKKNYKQKQPEFLKKSPEFWMEKLDNPLLSQACKEKMEGKNLPVKPEEHSLLYIIAMYIPNRLIDLTDIFTIEAGFGPQASLELTMTKWFEFGGTYGDNYFIEKGYNRQYGGGYNAGYSYSCACINQEELLTDYTFGTVKNFVITEQKNSLIPDPSESAYKNGSLDFWEIGVHAGWLVNFGVAFHPVSLVNFFTGFVFIRLTDTDEL